MRKILLIACLSSLLPAVALAQEPEGNADVFNPVAKYLARGDAESLSVWFSDNLEIDMLGRASSYSRSQACQIMKSFFSDYTPRSFRIVHKSGSYPMNCAVGDMEGGGCKFWITIIVKTSGDGNAIQQIKIERK